MKEDLKKLILQIETPEELREVYELMKRIQVHLRGIATTQFRVGESVYFTPSKTGVKIEGVVVKVNPTTIKVNAGGKGMWRVSPTCLKKL